MQRNHPILWVTGILLLAAVLLLCPQNTLAQNKLDVIIHYIEGTPVKGKLEYQVDVTFSVIDSAGRLVRGLTVPEVSVSEDSRKVAVTSLTTTVDRPMSVVVVLDTSGSMLGAPAESARKAAAKFISSLGPDDQVAVISFNQQITRVSDFTKDRVAVSAKVNEIKAVENTGTCLYDAAYQAVTLAATIPSGRRAIILLTDGVDEIQRGVPCSSKKIDDVLQMASSGSTRVPIFTLGLGDRIDDKGLKRLSDMTGGRYQNSPTAGELNNLFTALSEQLKSEYILRYTSTSAPGAHTLILEVSSQGVKNQGLRQFLLPDLPLNISIIYPNEGQEVRGKIRIVAAVTGLGETVEKVEFLINGIIVGSDSNTPYELEWDFGTAPGGQALSAVARGKDNRELARAAVNVKSASLNLPAATAAPAATSPTAAPTVRVETPTTPNSSLTERPYLPYLIIGCIALLILAALIFIIIVSGKRRNSKKQASRQGRNPPPTYVYQDQLPPNPSEPGHSGLTESLTIDMANLEPAHPNIGALKVVFSDDMAMIGQLFNITKPLTTIGRATDNDLTFPKDTPVSRHHAIIEIVNNQVILTEVTSHVSGGEDRRPRYGTYVNGNKLEDEPARLNSGDEIRLGSRTTVVFNRLQPEKSPDPVLETVDDLVISENKTVKRFEQTRLG